MNLDGSNRTLNDQEELAEYVGRSILSKKFAFPPFAALSEVPGPKCAGRVVKRLEAEAEEAGLQAQYVEAHFRAGNASHEHLALLWDNSRWEASGHAGRFNYSESVLGRYLSVRLNERGGEHRRVLAVAVHLPHKKGRERAYQLLARHIEEELADCDSVVVAGDFNCRPTEIRDKVLPAGFELCIPEGVATTTTGSTSPSTRRPTTARPSSVSPAARRACASSRSRCAAASTSTAAR